jgi:hypothetical protein
VAQLTVQVKWLPDKAQLDSQANKIPNGVFAITPLVRLSCLWSAIWLRTEPLAQCVCSVLRHCDCPTSSFAVRRNRASDLWVHYECGGRVDLCSHGVLRLSCVRSFNVRGLRRSIYFARCHHHLLVCVILFFLRKRSRCLFARLLGPACTPSALHTLVDL